MNMSTKDVLLVLGNTESYYREVMEMLQYFPKRYDFQDALREYVQELLWAGEDYNPMQSELMMTAMTHIDWYAVAADFYDEYHNVE